MRVPLAFATETFYVHGAHAEKLHVLEPGVRCPHSVDVVRQLGCECCPPMARAQCSCSVRSSAVDTGKVIVKPSGPCSSRQAAGSWFGVLARTRRVWGLGVRNNVNACDRTLYPSVYQFGVRPRLVSHDTTSTAVLCTVLTGHFQRASSSALPFGCGLPDEERTPGTLLHPPAPHLPLEVLVRFCEVCAMKRYQREGSQTASNTVGIRCGEGHPGLAGPGRHGRHQIRRSERGRSGGTLHGAGRGILRSPVPDTSLSGRVSLTIMI